MKNVNLDIKNEDRLGVDEEKDDEEIVVKKQIKKSKNKLQESDDDEESSTDSTISENSVEVEKKSTKVKKIKKVSEEFLEETQFINKKRKRMIKFIKL